MSTAAVDLQEHAEDREPMSFTPAIVRHDSVLAAMLAPRADHYGEHLKHFARYAEDHGGEVSLVRDYFRDLNAAPCAANTKRIRRQAVKARLRAALRDGMDFNKAAQFREALSRLDKDSETRAPKVQSAAVGSDKIIRRDEYDRLITAASYRDELLLDFLWTTACGIPSPPGRYGRTNKIQAVSSYLGRSSVAVTMNFYTHEQLEDDELFDPEDGD